MIECNYQLSHWVVNIGELNNMIDFLEVDGYPYEICQNEKSQYAVFTQGAYQSDERERFREASRKGLIKKKIVI